MATFSRVSPTGWSQGDDTSGIARVSPTGWDQSAAAAAAFKAYWARVSNQLLGHAMKKNVASQIIGVQMISATDGSAFTGTVSALVTKDGGTQTAGGGAVTHEGNGFHTYTITQSETNADHVAVTFTGTGAVPATVQVYTTFPQTGDTFDRLGAPAGASIAADLVVIDDFLDTEIAAIKAKTDNLPASPAATSDIPSASTVASTVWGTAVPGAFGAGTAGKVLGDNLNATVSSRATQTSVDTMAGYVDTEVAAIKAKTDNLPASPAATSDIPSASTVASSVWGTSIPGAFSAGTAGKVLGDRIDATVSSRASQASIDTLTGYVDTEVAAIKAKTDNLPTNPAAVSDIPSAATIADAVWDETMSTHTTDGTYGGRIVRATNSNVELSLTGAHHAAADVHEFQADVITATAFAANAIDAATLASDVGVEIAAAVWDTTIASHINAGSTGEALNNTDLRGERTVIRGTVGNATTPSTTQFTPSALNPAGAAVDQFKGRIVIFDNDTATAALRGQATDITANSGAATPLFTFTSLTTAPNDGDTFSIV